MAGDDGGELCGIVSERLIHAIVWFQLSVGEVG